MSFSTAEVNHATVLLLFHQINFQLPMTREMGLCTSSACLTSYARKRIENNCFWKPAGLRRESGKKKNRAKILILHHKPLTITLLSTPRFLILLFFSSWHGICEVLGIFSSPNLSAVSLSCFVTFQWCCVGFRDGYLGDQ